MTAQIHETLILDGEVLSMAFCPPLPPDEGQLIPTTVEHIEQQDADGTTDFSCRESWTDPQGGRHTEEGFCLTYSTACWREYRATWEIRDGWLYLVAITGRWRIVGPLPLVADWFTGVLRVPRGRELLYVHMGFGSVFEEELHIMIEHGKVIGRRVHDNRGREHDGRRLGWANLPGGENRFPGDRDLN